MQNVHVSESQSNVLSAGTRLQNFIVSSKHLSFACSLLRIWLTEVLSGFEITGQIMQSAYSAIACSTLSASCWVAVNPNISCYFLEGNLQD